MKGKINMIGKLLGKIAAMPIRAVNVPVKAAKAVLDAMSDEPVRFEKNAIDDIADVVEKSVKKIGGE